MMKLPKNENQKIKYLKLQEDEYQLEMSLYDNNSIEFKVSLNSPMATCYFIENYNFETIKKKFLSFFIINIKTQKEFINTTKKKFLLEKK